LKNSAGRFRSQYLVDPAIPRASMIRFACPDGIIVSQRPP
jgi:hypothetical protein